MDKNVKIKVLEAWYTIDSILFNGHAKNVIKEGSKFREYISLKGALLSNLFEYYSHIKFSPVYKTQPGTLKELVDSARLSAINSKKLATGILKKKEVTEALKRRIVRESKEKKIKDINQFASKVINEKFTQLTLDNVLVGVPILESAQPTNCEDFKGQVLEDAYKMMRNSLIHLSKTCTRVSSKG